MPVTLTAVRADGHDTYDRIVFEFDGDLAGYRIEYVDGVTSCGSGEPVELDGDAILLVTLRAVNAHDEQGNSTVDEPEIGAGTRTISDNARSCDFEAVVGWAFGLRYRADLTVSELTDPTRLVIDITYQQ